MIMDSNFVEAEELDSRFAYVQVTHVVPYFSEEESPNRQSEYERNNNVNQFVFETPFTKPDEDADEGDALSEGGEKRVKTKPRAHGRLQDQWKRRVIVTTDYCFPYVEKRSPIMDCHVQEMSPIEVAIDEMESRVKELSEIINASPPDIKKLQLKLQGSISVQVNAGPLAYATTFLQDQLQDQLQEAVKYPVNQVARLRELYRLG